METRIKDNKLEEDLKTIVEWEADSANNEGADENGFEEMFQHLEKRSKEDTQPNLFGSRTYTSPASFDSSSGNSYQFRNEFLGDRSIRGPHQRFSIRNSNSNATKLRSEQQSEKLNMLRNVVEQIECPHKRKILLDFLDQTTLKTEYVTIRESSSSGEEVKGFRKRISQLPKRRHKSPISVIPKSHLHKRNRNMCAYSQERKRFSLVAPSSKTIADQEANLQNFVIERKSGSDEFDSKNGDKWYTEESKEVPLDAILNKLQNYPGTYTARSRAQSGYSASQDEATHPGEITKDFDPKVDFEVCADLEEGKCRRGKDIIILPADLIEKPNHTDEMVNSLTIRKWMNKFKSLLFFFIFIFVLGLALRTVFLEIKVNSYPSQIHRLNREINELHKSSAEWEKRYNEWKAGDNFSDHEGQGGGSPKSNSSTDPVIFAKSSP